MKTIKNTAPTNPFSGLHPALAARIPYFSKSGIPANILAEAMIKAGSNKGPANPGWAECLMGYGHLASNEGDDKLKLADEKGAWSAYAKASFWYFLARFPYISSDIAGQAYRLHIEAYKKSLAGGPSPLTEIYIPYEGHSIRTFLRLPEISDTSLPLVILWGGLDIWKSDMEIHRQSEALLNQGVATLTIDIPGTGECPILDSPQDEKWFLTVLEVMRNHPKIDASRIACYGLSFGGYWATKLSVMVPELKAVVNIGGPAHLTFLPDWVSNLPVMTKLSLGAVIGVHPFKELILFSETLNRRSLLNQGLLPTQQNAPLLCLNGEKDEVVPIREFEVLKENGVQTDTLVFANDRHVASRNGNLRDAFVTLWLMEKLKVAQ